MELAKLKLLGLHARLMDAYLCFLCSNGCDRFC